jgi:hypothetical protein
MMMFKMSTIMPGFLRTSPSFWRLFMPRHSLSGLKGAFQTFYCKLPLPSFSRAIAWVFLLPSVLLILGALSSLKAEGQEASDSDSSVRLAPYLLESLSVVGSTRLDADAIIRELALKPGSPISDDLVMEARSQLLGIGIYKSVVLYLRKGTSPGKAILIVELEDEGYTIGPWAMGGSFGMTQGESPLRTGNIQEPAVGYRLNLVGRNLFRQLHRGSMTVDTDSFGAVRYGEVAYGLPRFAAESVEFDARIKIADPNYRYLQTLGFGQKADALWSWSDEDFDHYHYGVSLYANDGKRFAMPGFPTLVAGPKIGFTRENRLHGFMPGQGYAARASLILPPAELSNATVEIGAARTTYFLDWPSLTLDGDVLAVASGAQSLRTTIRFDVPVDKRPGSAALFSLSLQGGVDRTAEYSAFGSSATMALQHHSPGFIAEIALKIVRSPDQLLPDPAPLGGE